MLNCAAARASPRATQAIRTPVINTEILTHATYTRSKKWRFAFQTFTETPATAPSILGFGITHQPHEGGDGAKCGARFADTPCTVSLKVTSANQMPKETGKHPCWRAFPAQSQR
jgi:hypothetical protein